MKIISRETLLEYLSFSQLFVIHTKVSMIQFGAASSQNDKQIALYSSDLYPA